MKLFNKCKKIPLVQVYYNQDFEVLIVPNAVEKNMWCHVSIEPTERVMPDSSPDELGNSIIRVMKIAKKAPKVIKEEIELSKYWKQTKYKSFTAFSKHFQSIHIRKIGNKLKIERWIANNKGYSPTSDNEFWSVSAKITAHELGIFIRGIFNIEN